MRKYVTTKGNFTMLFNTKENALEHLKSHPDETYKEYNEWRYYSPNSRNSTTRYENITGETFEQAIEKSFEKITKDVGFYGASGYTLESVRITDNKDGSATLEITGWSFSNALVGFEKSMLSDEKKKHIEVEILDISEGDIPNGIIEVEIKR